MTSRRGGSKGAGVPRPRQANSHTHGRPTIAPIATTIQPSGRGESNAVRPAIHLGTKYVHSEMKSGATMSARASAKTLRATLDNMLSSKRNVHCLRYTHRSHRCYERE